MRAETMGADNRASDALGLGDWVDVTSAADGRRYRIFMSRPIGPAPLGGYPLIVTTDANLLFATIAQQAAIRALAGDLEDALVVGIGYPVAPADALRERMIDFARPRQPVAGRDGAASPLDMFIGAQLLPLIERCHPIDPARRSLFGYSLARPIHQTGSGGLAGVA